MNRFTAYTSALALLVMTLISCERDRLPDGRSAIGFGAAATSTKGGATNDNIASNGSAFIVRGSVAVGGGSWAVGDAITLFDGVTVTSNGSAWSYEPLRYWYMISTYRFRAVWPASAFGTSGASYTDTLEDDAVISGFTVGANADVDLLLSDIVPVTTDFACTPSSTGLTSEGKVNLTFGHILSQVNVSVAQQVAAAGYIVTEVSLSGLYGTGSYEGTSTEGSWTPGGTAGSWTKTYATPLALSGTALSTIWDGGLFLMPQSLSGATLTVKYKESASGPEQTVSASLGSGAWEQGTSYDYQATLSATEIAFTVKVVDWVDGGTVTLQK